MVADDDARNSSVPPTQSNQGPVQSEGPASVRKCPPHQSEALFAGVWTGGRGGGGVRGVDGVECDVTARRQGVLGAGTHPGVVQDLLQGGPVRRPHAQTPLDQLLALRGDLAPEEESRSENLVVVFEGDVAAHHVVQEHAQRPDRRRSTVVPVEADPLGRTVHPGSCRD